MKSVPRGNHGASLTGLIVFTFLMVVLAGTVILLVSRSDNTDNEIENNGSSSTESENAASSNQTQRATLLDLSDATDVDHRPEWERRANETEDCGQPLSIVGELQGVAFEVEALVRDMSEPLPPERETELGQALHDALVRSSTPIVQDPDLQAYIERQLDVLSRLRINSSYDLQAYIIQHPEPNALVTMGGFVYIHSGLVEEGSWVLNEAQLFNVLAHEVGHLDLRHIALVIEQMEQFGFQFDDPYAQISYAKMIQNLRRAYSREQEVEADMYAYQRMKEVGYSNLQAESSWYSLASASGSVQRGPETIIDVLNTEWERLRQSHPHALERSCNYRQWLREASPQYDKAYIGTRNFEQMVTAFDRIF